MAGVKSLTIQDAQRIARIRGGRCMSKEYIDGMSYLKWMCRKGHTWDMPYRTVQQGGWCVQCNKAEVNEEKLEVIRKIAEKKNGVCLSTKFVNINTKLKFKCKRAHTFEMTPAHLRVKNFWCRKCGVIEKRLKTLEHYKGIGEKKGAICLTQQYSDRRPKLHWQCKRGHRFYMTPMRLLKGDWCSQCNTIENREYVLAELNAIAKKRGGKCLAETYIHKDRILKWQCKKGHVFTGSANRIKNAGAWCAVCKQEQTRQRLRKYSISDLKRVAAERGGQFLSKEYINIHKPVKWQCAKGHIWNAIIHSVINHDTWCKLCYRESTRKLVK